MKGFLIRLQNYNFLWNLKNNNYKTLLFPLFFLNNHALTLEYLLLIFDIHFKYSPYTPI